MGTMTNHQYGAAGPRAFFDEMSDTSSQVSYAVSLLAAKLRSLNIGDRRHDSAVTTIALAPMGAQLDRDESLDGWDILTADGEVWLGAEDVPYCTSYVDAAQDLCRLSAPDVADAIIATALETVMRQPHRFGQGDIAGLIARHILADLIEWKSCAKVG